MTDEDFALRIRERYPEGLTGLFAIGGTRTTYILEYNRNSQNPGKIQDFADYGIRLQEKYLDFARIFIQLGGQNLIISAFSFIGFYNRGAEYAELATREMERLIDEIAVSFYKQHDLDPHFAGIDTLLRFLPDSFAYKMGKRLQDFQNTWQYQPGRRKLIWEIASIPNLTLWNAFQDMPEPDRDALNNELESLDNLLDVQRCLYRHFSKLVLGVEIPMPHFYLGTNKGGDLKLRSPLGIGLTAGEYLRLYYTPYPSLFITCESLKAILEDLAFHERFHSSETDYEGQYTSELVQKEYERVIKLASDPASILGYTRKVTR